MKMKQWLCDFSCCVSAEFGSCLYMEDLTAQAAADFPPSLHLSWVICAEQLTVGFRCQTIHKKFLRRFDTIFGLKMMMKSGLEKKYFKISRWPSELPVICNSVVILLANDCIEITDPHQF